MLKNTDTDTHTERGRNITQSNIKKEGNFDICDNMDGP